MLAASLGTMEETKSCATSTTLWQQMIKRHGMHIENVISIISAITRAFLNVHAHGVLAGLVTRANATTTMKKPLCQSKRLNIHVLLCALHSQPLEPSKRRRHAQGVLNVNISFAQAVVTFNAYILHT